MHMINPNSLSLMSIRNGINSYEMQFCTRIYISQSISLLKELRSLSDHTLMT